LLTESDLQQLAKKTSERWQKNLPLKKQQLVKEKDLLQSVETICVRWGKSRRLED
jgi:hypothetical protein